MPSEIREYFFESRITDNQSAEQTGTVGRADAGMSEQWPQCKEMVQGKRLL